MALIPRPAASPNSTNLGAVGTNLGAVGTNLGAVGTNLGAASVTRSNVSLRPDPGRLATWEVATAPGTPSIRRVVESFAEESLPGR